ncbi:Hypothetical predicted protein [Paramuricea clavata]|uniref:Bro-N domain-containing protein n=1 Tax=Paramuricea clavata TaxID=317549 RepID=A0A6S7H9R9_PARCT|nr:Hypothetical predicted protein [Paramuricea clavata]
MEKLFRNPELNVSVRTVRWGEGILFYAKDVAESLGYADPKKAVQKLVRKQNKMSKVNAVNKSEMGSEVYDALLLTAGAIGISMASKKLLKEPLGTPENTKGMLKLAVSVSLSSLLVSYLKKNKYIPDNPIKT